MIASQGVAGTPVEDVDSTWHINIAIYTINVYTNQLRMRLFFDQTSLRHAGPQDPVLINEKLARGFAKAWSVGSEQQEVAKCMEFVIICFK